MESESDRTPLIALVGQTASGKSAMALELATRFNGEIICADSRTIYKGMDIGTAKPTRQERQIVPHHLIDIVSPDHPIAVAQYKKFADDIIKEVASRGKTPFLVGGTGLYVDSVIFNFSFKGEPDPAKRLELEGLSVEELQKMHEDEGIPLPNNPKNPRHLIRQLETGGRNARARPRPNTLVIGIMLEKEELKARIEDRVDTMLDLGLEGEVRDLVTKYGWQAAPLKTIGYQEFREFFDGTINRAELRELIIRHTMQYAKRQKTWFKRNKNVHWICNVDESVDLITTHLNKSYISN